TVAGMFPCITRGPWHMRICGRKLRKPCRIDESHCKGRKFCSGKLVSGSVPNSFGVAEHSHTTPLPSVSSNVQSCLEAPSECGFSAMEKRHLNRAGCCATCKRLFERFVPS